MSRQSSEPSRASSADVNRHLYRFFSATVGSARGSEPPAAGTLIPAPPAAAPSSTGSTQGPRTFKICSRPDVCFTWASDFPDKVKVRKPFTLALLHFELGADWRKRDNQLRCGCSCKDRLLGGDISLDVAQKQVLYRRSFPVADGARLAGTAQCSYADLRRGVDNLKPLLGLRYEFGRGTASLGAHSLHMRRQLPITRFLGLELTGDAELPAPSAELAFSSHNQTSASLEGPLCLSVSQANLVVRL